MNSPLADGAKEKSDWKETYDNKQNHSKRDLK